MVLVVKPRGNNRQVLSAKLNTKLSGCLMILLRFCSRVLASCVNVERISLIGVGAAQKEEKGREEWQQWQEDVLKVASDVEVKI